MDLDIYRENSFVPALDEKYSKFGYQVMRSVLRCTLIPPKKRLIVPRNANKSGTLFVDLDNTLIVSEIVTGNIPNGKYDFVLDFPTGRYGIRVRQHVFSFLKYCKNILGLEMIVFTTSSEYYADKIVELIQPEENFFDHLLSSEYCHRVEESGWLIKDLRGTQRDMKTSVLIDDLLENFTFSPNNAIPIKKFTMDTKKEEDNELLYLTQFLKAVFSHSDVRDYLYEKVGKRLRSNYAT